MGMELDRRRLLMGLSALMGGMLSPVAVKALDTATDIPADAGFRSFDENEVALMRAVIDTMLPATETPSATGVGVDLYIDHMLAAVLSAEEGAAVKRSLKRIDAAIPGFVDKTAAEQQALLSVIDGQMWQETPEAEEYRAFKSLAIVGYFTSEIGATVALAFDPVPGPFHNGTTREFSRTWAS
ncbi:MAG: gluconate 2-dehydrogenase subunit 3 family protein [Alphaproteobacteria bacterium]|nr:MAG: gluconate 2-dehydrogenase subunit 3 family protein [Alphaproteobacteria bacterium]